jgi:hypothetical protein
LTVIPVAGKARINYIEKESGDSKNKKKESSSDGSKSIDVDQGDVYRLEEGTTFYISSYPAPTRVKFRIYAIFNTANIEDTRVRVANMELFFIGKMRVKPSNFIIVRKNPHLDFELMTSHSEGVVFGH